MKRFNERIDMDLDLHIEAKRSTLRKFINDTVSYFTSRNCVPTFEQVYDYISTDRWAKSNIYNGSNCSTQQRDFECLPIKDMCENIINLCSFNLADIYESKNSKSIRLRICEGVGDSLIDELNDLEYFPGKQSIPNYTYIDEFEKILKKFDVGTIIAMDWEGGVCYFKKFSNEYVAWLMWMFPHGLSRESTSHVAEWLCARGVWCKKPLWIASDDDFDSAVNKKRGSFTGTPMFPRSIRNYGQKPDFYGI